MIHTRDKVLAAVERAQKLHEDTEAAIAAAAQALALPVEAVREVVQADGEGCEA